MILTLMMFLFLQASKKDAQPVIAPCWRVSNPCGIVDLSSSEDNDWPHKQKLAYALTTRVLTDAEMKEVLEYGPTLYVHMGQVYDYKEMQKQFLNDLAVQTQIVLLQKAKTSSSKAVSGQPQYQDVPFCPKRIAKAPCISFVNGNIVYFMLKNSKEVCPDWAAVCFRGGRSEKGRAWPESDKGK